jgi:2-polyprenyl-3-methyl-5-hydroxy-6-metoxy-1,4-benzoquinol methylase
MSQLQLHREVEKTFYDDQAKSLNPLRRWIHLRRYHIINSFVKEFYLPENTVVDFGAGSCLWNIDRLPVHGIDINESLLAYGKRQGRLASYRISDIKDSNIDDNSVDTLVATETLEHISDINACVKNMYRILANGGHAIISVPHDAGFSLWSILFGFWRFYKGSIRGDDYYKQNCGHVQKFSPEKLKAVFLENGFNISAMFSFWTLHIFLVAQKNKRSLQRTYEDVTVIIPVKDYENKLSGIISDLMTRYPGVSVVVANDGSVEENRIVISKLKGLSGNINLLDRSQNKARGLTVSVLDAVDLVKTKYFVVMDGDGQHSFERVESIYNQLLKGNQLCVVSRISVFGWMPHRRFISFIGNSLSKFILRINAKKFPPDVLSGFFGVATNYWHKTVQGKRDVFISEGYKILFQFLKMCDKNIAISNIYHVLSARELGESRINWRVYRAFLQALLR